MKKATTPRSSTTGRMLFRCMAFLAMTVGIIPVIFHSRLTNSFFQNILLVGRDANVGIVPEESPLKTRQDKKEQKLYHHDDAASNRELTTVVVQESTQQQHPQQQHEQQQQHDHHDQDHGQEKDYVLFYNVYLPGNRTRNALRIMQEQLAQVRDSFAVTSRKNVTTLLYYNTIGKENVWTRQDYVQQHFCSSSSNSNSSLARNGGKLKCIHLHHYAKGFEEITLHDLYQWCSSASSSLSDSPLQHSRQQRNAVVTYLHNKGSHHNRQGGSNDYWRWHMTHAVTSADCITRTMTTRATTNTDSHNDNDKTRKTPLSCQVCGLLWQTIPSLHFPGNFWTARCDYIRRLLPPTAHDYGQKQNDMAAVLKELTSTTTTTTTSQLPVLTANLYPSTSNSDNNDTNDDGGGGAAAAAEWSTGTSRYMWEQWIGSHPALQDICDLSPTPDIDVWKERTSIMTGSRNNNSSSHTRKNRLEFVLAKAPRRALLDKHWQIKPRPNRTILTQRHARKREMHLLPGLLWKWYLLYGALPQALDNDDSGSGIDDKSSSSWVYTHFPDGRDWKRRVAYILSLRDNNNSAINYSSNNSLMQDLFALATKEDETGTILTTTKRRVAAAAAATRSKSRSTTSTNDTAMTKISRGGGSDVTANNTTNWRTFVGGNPDSDKDDSVNTAVAPWVVFYNIFIPPVNDTVNDEDDNAVVQNVLRIVEEQLLQTRQSYAASSANAANGEYNTSRRHSPLTVFYTTIGRRDILTDSVMAKLCGTGDDDENTNINDNIATTTDSSIIMPRRSLPILNCRHSGHHDEGFEDLTLQRLYNFCQSNNNNDDNSVNQNDDDNNMSVIYMHSKGTFHNWPDASNERWRRHLTAAVTSQACLEPFQHKSSSPSSNTAGTCNVCGLQFYPVWTPFFPGNFFAAQCNYIRELLPLADFATNMTSILAEMTQRKRQGRFLTNLYNPNREGALGVERYAWEHWIASHPTVRPCDVSKTADFRYWVAEDHEPDYEWSMAPRHDLATARWYRIQTGKRLQVLADKSQRMREYYLLAGNLFKWQRLYNSSPPADSWAWDFFPDGPEWHEAVAAHGLDQVVDRITDEYAKK